MDKVVFCRSCNREVVVKSELPSYYIEDNRYDQHHSKEDCDPIQ